MQSIANGSLYSPISSDRSSSTNSAYQEFGSCVTNATNYNKVNHDVNRLNYNCNVAIGTGGSWKSGIDVHSGTVPQLDWNQIQATFNAFQPHNTVNTPYLNATQNFNNIPAQVCPPKPELVPSKMKNLGPHEGLSPFLVCLEPGGYAYVSPQYGPLPEQVPSNLQKSFQSSMPMLDKQQYFTYPEQFNHLTPQDSNNQSSSRPKRMAYKADQVAMLLKEYCVNKYISRDRMRELGKALGLTPKQIKVWFQNRRMKDKREKDPKMETSPTEGVVHDNAKQEATEDSRKEPGRDLELPYFVSGADSYSFDEALDFFD